MKHSRTKYIYIIVFILAGAFYGNYSFSCTGGTYTGTMTAATSNWQTLGGINGGEYYNLSCTAGRVYIFSFCQGGGSYTDDPQIQIMNSSGTPVTDGYNDDHCGLGSELVWVCPANGTYRIGFFEYYCQTDGQYLGTVAYKYLPTPTRADCLGARPLCTSSNTVNNLESTGAGHYYDLYNYTTFYPNLSAEVNNCPDCIIQGEHYSNWYSFYAQSGGSLTFNITPLGSGLDFDWAVWDMTYLDCNDLPSGSAYGQASNSFPNPMTCNYCMTTGSTGLNTSDSETCEPNNGGSCDNWNRYITLTSGHEYVLFIDNYSSTTTGYSINFGGSASVYDQTAPVLDNIVYTPVCGVDNITVQFSEAVSCTSMQNSCITVSGPSGSYTTSDIWSQTCEAAVGNTYSSGTFYDDIWTIDLGDYLMDPGSHTITLNPGCATDVCGNGMPGTSSSSLNFTITGISATLNVVAQAGCPGQSVGQLSVTGVSGGCGYGYTYNWSTGSTASSISGLSAGTYSVTVTDGIGRCEWTDDVTIYNAPPINPTASSNSPVCAGSTLNLSGGSSTGSSYSWSGPAGFTSSLEDPSTVMGDDDYTGTYSLTVTDTYGCTASTSTLVTVYSNSWNPSSAIADPSAICTGSNTTLTVTPATDPNILDYSTWTVGTGSATGFNQNGSTTENYRINSTDPWGNSTVIWEARPDATSGADGGWNTTNFAVDNTKTYRYSVWVWRNSNGNGNFYLGCHGYGSVNGVYSVSGAGPNTNPYFISSSNVPTSGRWELIVGHVHPYTYSGSTHPESGRYTVSNGKVANISTDYKWLSQTTSGNFRTYLYYCTNTSVRQRWAYPRVDICDGTEPTINELLNGFDPNETLGTGADWEWYSGSCGGTHVGYGENVVVSPGSSTTYYVRAEGTCNTTGCVNTSVTVNTFSTAPTTISGTTTICNGNSTTLTASGGTAGTNSNLNWFEGSCGGAFMEEWFTQPYSTGSTTLNSVDGELDVTSTSNDPMIFMPGLGSFDPSVYKYINVRYRVVSGTAGNTEIFFYNSAHGGAVGGESASGALISDGSWHILNIDMTSDPDYLTGGNITGWRYDWCTASGVRMEIDYIALSSSRAVGQGTSIVVSPTSTASYYVLRSGPCNTTSCANTTVTVDTSNPTYVGYANITGYQYQESANVYWVKGGNNFSIDITHSDNITAKTQYFGFNKDDCNPNSCGGAPYEIKSYNSYGTFTDWMANNLYIDIVSSNCVDGDGVCTDNDVTRRWVSNIKSTCEDWDYKLHTYLYDHCNFGVGYTDMGLWVKVDNTAPTHDEVTVNESCWSTDGTNTYTITVKSTEPRSGFGGTYGIMALVNYHLGEPNAGGYFAWHPTSYTHTDDQMACTGGGFVSKASTWGGSRIDLISASTSVVGDQRTVTFVVRPHSDYIELDGVNKISMYTSDKCNNYRGWTLFNTNFTTMKVPDTPTSATTICNGGSANLSTTSSPASGITYYWQTSPTGTSTSIGSGSSVVVSPSSTTTYYVRPYSSLGCWGEASAGVTVTVNPLLPVSVSINASSNPICFGNSVTFTATPTNGGTPTYQWKLNGANVGTNSPTYVNNELDDGDQVYCIMTSSETCCSGNPATSNTITMDIVTPPTTGLVSGDYVWSGNVSDAWENSANWIVFNGSDFDLAITKPGVDDNVFLIDYGTCVVQNPATNIGSTEYCNDIYIYTALTLGNASLLNVYGDWENYGTFTAGAGKVKFNGSSVQNIISGGDSFYDIEFANTNLGDYDITLSDIMTITHNSVFSQGIVNPGANKVIYTIGSSSGEGNTRSFIDGLVERQGSGSFVVPCGHVNVRDIGAGNITYKIWAPIAINPSSNTTTTIRYYFDNSGLPTWWNAGTNLDESIHHVTDREYWLVNSTSSFTNVTLYWKDNAHTNGSVCTHSFCTGDNNFVSSDLTVAYWNGSMWIDAGGTAVNNHDVGSITSSTSVPFGAKSQTFITFATKENLNPLPVELSKFDATCIGKAALVEWETLSETNNDYFILEKSNGRDGFFEVARIDGAGNSNEPIQYEFYDEFLFEGDNYFRLIQVDFDGLFEIFDIISLNCIKLEEGETTLYAYPNPFNDELNVVIENLEDDDFVLEIFDDLGRLVYSQKYENNATNFETTINLKDFSPSVYNLRTKTSDNVLNFRVIKK